VRHLIAEEFHCCRLVLTVVYQDVEDGPVLIDGVLEEIPGAVDKDGEEYLTEVPRISSPGPSAPQLIGIPCIEIAQHDGSLVLRSDCYVERW
jgi:hypothetical protein